MVNRDDGLIEPYSDTRISGALEAANNLSDLASASTARTNLGLGGAAVLSVGTTTGTVAAGDDSRITGAVQSTRQVIAGTGLTGGGALSADRTLAVAYGTTSGTAAQGNDSRITGAAPVGAVRTITDATVTAAAWDVILGDCTSNAITVTLPTAAAGIRVTVKKTDAGVNKVTITGTVDGVTNPQLGTQYQTIVLVSDGTGWFHVGGVAYP